MNALLKRIATPTLVLGTAMFLFACDTTGSNTATTMPSAVSMGIVNSNCPMTNEKIDPNGPTATWKGATIGFCCGGCVANWNKKSDAEKSAFVAQARN